MKIHGTGGTFEMSTDGENFQEILGDFSFEIKADASRFDSAMFKIGEAIEDTRTGMGEALQLGGRVCPSCGTFSPIGVEECRECGTGLAGDICPWCGRHHILDRKTCWNGWAGCGGELH